MKKTIRKKIMRDLQQAFVDDPSKFQNDPKDHPINLNSLNFDPKTHNPSDQNFLDLLRDSEDSGLGSQPSANEDGGTPVLVKSGSGSGKHYLLQSLSLSLFLSLSMSLSLSLSLSLCFSSSNEDGGTPVLVKSGSGSGKHYFLLFLCISVFVYVSISFYVSYSLSVSFSISFSFL
jgi:hypothetical protein